jgi:hypothetical protein
MGPGFDTYIWDQRNRLVAFDTWGAQEWVQLPFESDTGAEVIDAIGNAPNGGKRTPEPLLRERVV